MPTISKPACQPTVRDLREGLDAAVDVFNRAIDVTVRNDRFHLRSNKGDLDAAELSKVELALYGETAASYDLAEPFISDTKAEAVVGRSQVLTWEVHANLLESVKMLTEADGHLDHIETYGGKLPEDRYIERLERPDGELPVSQSPATVAGTITAAANLADAAGRWSPDDLNPSIKVECSSGAAPEASPPKPLPNDPAPSSKPPAK